MSRPASPLRSLTLATLMGAGLAAPALAQSGGGDLEALKAAAAAMLDKHCARCHQVGKLEGRDTPSKGFGNVTQLDELLKNPAMIKPGVPEGSRIYNMVVNSQMPYDVYQEGRFDLESPTKDEILALRKWIEASKVTCAPADIISSADLLKTVADDLRGLPKHRILTTRYVTLSHFVNGCSSDEQMEVYRQGVVKFLNSMSRVSDVVKMEAVDPAKTVLRFNLVDLGWTAEDWEMLVAAYPYRNYADDPLYGFATKATGTGMPYMRGDWLVFYAAQPPFYEKLLRLPASFQELQKKLGLDVDANIANYRAQRAGFQNSGVSQHNRLIERHSIATGYFWTSYDFGGDSDAQSFFAHPTGPKGPDGFHHDGGETIFSLPNGFNGYYLNTAKGDQLAKGPTNIVRDPKRRDQAVTNGISCMSCHDQGIKLATDEVREHVLGAKSSFPKHIRDAVKELYPEKAVMDRILADDAARFKAAVVKAGLNPSLQLNGDEPVTALARRYEQSVDMVSAAAELGVSLDDMAKGESGASAAVIRRLKLGSLPREQMEGEYGGLATAMTEDVLLAKGATVAAAAGYHPTANDGVGDLTLTADKAVYHQNDVLVLSVTSSTNCFLSLINKDGKGKATLIFPNKFQQNNAITAGRSFTFGDASAPFRLRLADKGTETVIAECSQDKNANPDVTADYKAGGLTDMGDYVDKTLRSQDERAKALRQVVVEGQKPAAGPPPEVAKLKGVLRTAIKVQVD